MRFGVYVPYVSKATIPEIGHKCLMEFDVGGERDLLATLEKMKIQWPPDACVVAMDEDALILLLTLTYNEA